MNLYVLLQFSQQFLEYFIEKKFTLQLQFFTQIMISNVLLDRTYYFKLKLLINRPDLHFIAYFLFIYFFFIFGKNVKLNQLLFVTAKKELIRLNVTSIDVILRRGMWLNTLISMSEKRFKRPQLPGSRHVI